MDLAKTLYLIVFSVYVVFFGLFLRFYIWKIYSQRNFWQKRPSISLESLCDLAENLGKEIPFISILVPARNEADVIENTIRHLRSLEYPHDRFEIIVATDEKEAKHARSVRKHVISRVRRVIESRGTNEPEMVPPDEAEQFKAALLWTLVCASVPKAQAKEVYDFCRKLDRARGRAAQDLLASCPFSPEVAANILALYRWLLRWEVSRWLNKESLGNNLSTETDLKLLSTQHIEAFRQEVSCKIRRKGKSQFAAEIGEFLAQVYPTTQEVVDSLVEEFGDQGPTVKHVIVPTDFDGQFRGRCIGQTVPSTKGRALNWALQFVDPRSEMCGFYDAESRPDTRVMLYIAYRRMIDPVGSRIFQGPVFQVRNFYKMRPFCRIASLYQAVAHDWYLPWLFKTLPFVGGTNLFVERKLLESLHGWDHGVLTEDLEFGTRAYLYEGAWPQYLPYPSSEQTPPTYKAFFRQRLRWATGHIQVVQKVEETRLVPEERRRELLFHLVLKGQFEWVVYQLATFVPPTALILQYNKLLDETAVPTPLRWMLMAFSAIYFSFTFYAYLRYKPYFDTAGKPDSRLKNALVVGGLLLLPLAAFLFPIPFTSALILKSLGREPKLWVKTPRTSERAA